MSIQYDDVMGEWAVLLGPGRAVYFGTESEAKMADRVITFIERGQTIAGDAQEVLSDMQNWLKTYDLAMADLVDETALADTSIIAGTYTLGEAQVTGKLGTMQAAIAVMREVLAFYDASGAAFAKFAKED